MKPENWKRVSMFLLSFLVVLVLSMVFVYFGAEIGEKIRQEGREEGIQIAISTILGQIQANGYAEILLPNRTVRITTIEGG